MDHLNISQSAQQHDERKVHFNDLIEIHTMVTWNYAYRSARKGPWETMARDRFRFHDRIRKIEIVLDQVLNTSHRRRIYEERFIE
jgi:hypothetical protein